MEIPADFKGVENLKFGKTGIEVVEKKGAGTGRSSRIVTNLSL